MIRAAVSLKELRDVLKLAGLFAPRKTTLPILRNVRLSLSGFDSLVVESTDLDKSARLTLAACAVSAGGPVVAEGAGSGGFVLVDLRDLSATLKALSATVPDGAKGARAAVVVLNVVRPALEADPGRLCLSLAGGGGAALEVSIRPAHWGGDFPRVHADELDGSRMRGVRADKLSEALTRALPAVSTELRIRPALTGISFDTRAAAVVGTDGHRLVVADLDPEAVLVLPVLPAHLKGHAEGLIPAASCSALLQLLALSEAPGGTVWAGWTWEKDTPQGLTVRGPGYSVHFRTLEGPFPNWRQCMPEAHTLESVLVLPRAEALSALAAAYQCADACSRAVHLRLGLPDSLPLVAWNCQTGAKFRGVVPAALKGAATPGAWMGFNAGYILDALQAVAPAERVEWDFHGVTRASVLRAPGLTILLMPLRVEAEALPLVEWEADRAALDARAAEAEATAGGDAAAVPVPAA